MIMAWAIIKGAVVVGGALLLTGLLLAVAALIAYRSFNNGRHRVRP